MSEREKEKEYVEDSTKGNSLIQPLSYKGDVLTQTWVDSRVLATLANWMESVGFYPKTLSDVARRPLELLMEMLVIEGKVGIVDDTNIAREFLSRRFRVNLNRGGRGGKNILHNQVLSDIRSDVAENLIMQRKKRDSIIPNSIFRPDEDFVNRATRIYKQNPRVSSTIDEHTQLIKQLTKEDMPKLGNPPISIEEYESIYQSKDAEDKKTSDEYLAVYLEKKRINRSGADILAKEEEDRLENSRKLTKLMTNRLDTNKSRVNMTDWEREELERKQLEDLNKDPRQIIEEMKAMGSIVDEKTK